jgi:alkanesulfonate monooxygenase SsuD/methylene tetrahydromethanopterin reductase-like flavin-dependent oxidoreductase (luciferase family)
MKIGVCSANSGPYTTRDMLVLLSEAAEKVGLESIWVSEHLVVPDPRTPPSQMDPDDPILDPVTALAFMAGRTRSVRLGTGIIVLPIRNPLILAKELATVDVLSCGRLMFGVGVGYV